MRLQATVAGVLVLFLTSASWHRSEAAPSRCSPVITPSSQWEPFFIGTALADTVYAGPGEVVPSADQGHWGKGAAREVYGQLVRIDLMKADTVAELLSALDAASRVVVVVPWDYDPSCRPTYWNRSARWVESELEGFYNVQLRPRSLWVDERPTFDAFMADLQPYPHAPLYQAGYNGTNALQERPSLNAREYFSLYSALPSEAEIAVGSSQALRRLNAWKSANPQLVTRYPADEILDMTEWRLARRR
jgi:hypothetical protein